MKIIVKNEDEKKVVTTLLSQLCYTWDTNGQDGYYKAFEYVNDRPECWENGELIKDYRPLLRQILDNIGTTNIKIG